jgi:hypothetical protein
MIRPRSSIGGVGDPTCPFDDTAGAAHHPATDRRQVIAMMAARFFSAALLVVGFAATAASEFRYEADSLQIDEDTGRIVVTAFRTPLPGGSTLEAATATFETAEGAIPLEVALQRMTVTDGNGGTISADEAVYYPHEQRFSADRVTVDGMERADATEADIAR